MTRRADAFLVLAFYSGRTRMGAAAAHARLHLLLSSGRDDRELCAGLRLESRQHAGAGCYGPMSRSAFAGFVAMLPISAAFIGTSMATFNRLMIFQNWI